MKGRMKSELQIWQFIILIVFYVGILITMFLPAFQVNADNMYKAYVAFEEDYVSILEIGTHSQNAWIAEVYREAVSELNSQRTDTRSEEKKEDFKNELEKYERENDISFGSVSAFDIMTKNIKNVLGQIDDKIEELNQSEGEMVDVYLRAYREIYQGLKQKWRTMKAVLFIAYAMDFLLLVATIIVFCMKYSKMILLIINSLHTGIAAIIFGLLRFGLAGSIAGYVTEHFSSILKAELSNSQVTGYTEQYLDLHKSLVKHMFSSFYSIGLLVALGIVILLLVASILFLFVGGTAPAMNRRNIQGAIEPYNTPAGPVNYPVDAMSYPADVPPQQVLYDGPADMPPQPGPYDGPLGGPDNAFGNAPNGGANRFPSGGGGGSNWADDDEVPFLPNRDYRDTARLQNDSLETQGLYTQDLRSRGLDTQSLQTAGIVTEGKTPPPQNIPQRGVSPQTPPQRVGLTQALGGAPYEDDDHTVPVQMVLDTLPPGTGRVRCTKGIAAGQGYMLPENRKVLVGKNPQKANLVINYPGVSNLHCSIRYIAARNSYIIKDHSTNGTYINGMRLQKDAAVEVPAGTLMYLADANNEITLG